MGQVFGRGLGARGRIHPCCANLVFQSQRALLFGFKPSCSFGQAQSRLLQLCLRIPKLDFRPCQLFPQLIRQARAQLGKLPQVLHLTFQQLLLRL